jgi:hypothetical protein
LFIAMQTYTVLACIYHCMCCFTLIQLLYYIHGCHKFVRLNYGFCHGIFICKFVLQFNFWEENGSRWQWKCCRRPHVKICTSSECINCNIYDSYNKLQSGSFVFPNFYFERRRNCKNTSLDQGHWNLCEDGRVCE